jgi:segregation and condensation protein A
MSYEVQTEVFEGPFDLLLHLILKEQVDIYEVSLSHIVDAYLGQLDRMITAAEVAREERVRDGGSDADSGSLDLELATEFLLIAATLVELKTRRLLPAESDIDLDEELGIWEERDLLLSRLLECKTFKNATVILERLAAAAGLMHPRRMGPDERFFNVAPDLLEGIDADDIKAAFIRALTPKPKPKVDLDHIAPITASVTDAMLELADELPRVGSLSFRALTGDLVDRIEVVVRFLAVLELFKQGHIELDQVDKFGDITITWVGDDSDVLVPVGADSYDG